MKSRFGAGFLNGAAVALTLLVSLPALAQDWTLDVRMDGTKIVELNWVDGTTTVPAISATFLADLRKDPILESSPEALHKVLIIPRRAASGYLYGDTILLRVGETVGETGIGAEPDKIAVAARGYYFTREEGAQYKINFFHLERDPADPTAAIELLTAKNAAQVESGVVEVDLTPVGATVQTGTTVVTYLPDGIVVNGSFVFSELSQGNRDVIEGEFNGVDMLESARNDSLNPCDSCDADLARIVEALFQRQQRNPLVWGRDGVNTEGLVHRLATEMAAGSIEPLEGWQIFQMSWAEFDTNGEVDVTLGKIRRLVGAARLKKVILYFPDVDQLIGLGVDGNLPVSDASSALIPELKIGRVLMLGLTGEEGIGRMRAHAPFYRTFREIEVAQPLGDDLVEILTERASQLRDEYKVVFSDTMIGRIIELTNRHIPDVAQPGKSLDAMQDIAAEHGPDNPQDDAAVEVEITNRMFLRWLAQRTRIPGLDPSDELREFLRPENFIPALSESVVGHQKAKEATHRAMLNVIGGGFSTGGNGAETGVQLLFFTGPSGVGKSFIPQVLSKMMREQLEVEWEIKTWEGQQFKDEASVNIMFGAPPGYVGFSETGGPMYKWVKNNPQSIMVFEELDKMHRAVHDSLYKLFDDGIVFDNSLAREAYFTRGLIFLTSNFGSIPDASLDPDATDDTPVNPRACEYVDDWDRWHIFGQEPRNAAVKTWDEDELKDQVLDKLRNSGALSPQMIGRIGKENIVIMHHFTRDEIAEIGMNTLNKMISQFDTNDITLVFSDELKDWMVNRAWGANGATAFDTGARSILNVIKFRILPKITEFALGDGFDPDRTHRVTWDVDVEEELDPATGDPTGDMIVTVTQR